MTVLLVLVGGAVGSATRYTTDRWVQAHHRLRFPLGTMAVNLVGCFILGLIAGGVTQSGWSADVQSLIGVGFCGGLTTFSTFSVELVTQLRGGLQGRALMYVATSVGGGIALAQAGWSLG